MATLLILFVVWLLATGKLRDYLNLIGTGAR